MDTLANIVVSHPDTISIVTTPKEVIFHSCHDAMPLGNVITICVTVAICLLIIAVAVGLCFRKMQKVKENEFNKKINAEKEKRESEQNYKRYKDQYDSAWRTFEYKLKLKPEEKVPEGMKIAIEEAEGYLKSLWRQETSDNTRNSQS